MFGFIQKSTLVTMLHSQGDSEFTCQYQYLEVKAAQTHPPDAAGGLCKWSRLRVQREHGTHTHTTKQSAVEHCNTKRNI